MLPRSKSTFSIFRFIFSQQLNQSNKSSQSVSLPMSKVFLFLVIFMTWIVTTSTSNIWPIYENHFGLSFVKITHCNVTFCTYNHRYQINENPDYCSLKIYPLITFLNRTDNGNKSRCAFCAMIPGPGWNTPKDDFARILGSFQFGLDLNFALTSFQMLALCPEHTFVMTTSDTLWYGLERNLLLLMTLFCVMPKIHYPSRRFSKIYRWG